MQVFLGAVLLLAAARSGCSVKTNAASVDRNRPVAKIVRLLKDMEEELKKEMADDKEVYATLDCWCKTNEAEKTKAIEVGQQTIAALEASIAADLARMKELEAKRKATMDEMYADQKALDQAEELRMEENKEFQTTETEYLEAIGACKGAIQVLGVHQSSFSQVQAVARSLKKAKVQDLLETLAHVSGGEVARTRVKVLKEFIQSAEAGSKTETMAFLSIPGYTSYAPQSGQIFGILEQMLVDFKANLADEQADEKKAVEEFEALKKAKLDEIAAAKKMVAEIDQEDAALREKNAQELKELKDTEDQLAMDQAFLADLKKKCAEADEEFEARMKNRLAEIAAVEDTIGILNSDEAFANFEKTTKSMTESKDFVEDSTVVFLQTESEVMQARRQRVTDLLRLTASRTGSPKLALLAASAQLDAFTKVKEIIDKLVVELQTQQADEVKHRDWCIDEFATNKEETQAADHKMDNLQQKKTDLETSIEKMTKKIKELTVEMKETQVEMGKASDNREAENAELAQTIEDQRLAQIILKKALTRMQEVYTFLQQQPGAAHIATSGNHTNAGNAPARFTKYEQHSGGNRVVQLLEDVITDSQKLEDEALTRSLNSQIEYEDFMQSSNKALAQMIKTKAGLEEALATAHDDLIATKTDIMDTLKVLEGLHDYKGDLHKSCDYILKNFDARQKARQAEIEALGEAKAILSGAK
jgi:peptidoglycan hydrolase CwlO-like protein